MRHIKHLWYLLTLVFILSLATIAMLCIGVMFVLFGGIVERLLHFWKIASGLWIDMFKEMIEDLKNDD